MSGLMQIGDLGFEALTAKPATLAAPSIGDLYSLWGVYKTISGAADWKSGVLAILKSGSFRAQFKALAKAVAALDSLMDDPAKVAEAQQAATSLLS